MRHLFAVLLSLWCISTVGAAPQPDAKPVKFKVFQVNLWHGGTKVADGHKAIVDMIDEVDADIVLLCELRDGKRMVPALIKDLGKRGKEYHGESLGLSVAVLSKIKPDKFEKTCIVPGDEGRAMVKASMNIGGQPVSIYSAHLDYRNYECYMPRGYSGATWKKINAPITDEQTVLEANRKSFRDEPIASFAKEARKDMDAGRLVILGGDFNEPSHLDWQADTKKLWDHNGAVINWDCSVMLAKAGFLDAFRVKFPNAAKYPGFTFPAGNRAVPVKELAWAPEADERDRIDFIYYSGDKRLKLDNCVIVGPAETVLRGKVIGPDTRDKVLTLRGTWPTDHRGTLAAFSIKPSPKNTSQH